MSFLFHCEEVSRQDKESRYVGDNKPTYIICKMIKLTNKKVDKNK